MEALNKAEQLEAAQALINAIEQDDEDRTGPQTVAATLWGGILCLHATRAAHTSTARIHPQRTQSR